MADERWQPARSIPTSGIAGQDEAERVVERRAANRLVVVEVEVAHRVQRVERRRVRDDHAAVAFGVVDLDVVQGDAALARRPTPVRVPAHPDVAGILPQRLGSTSSMMEV